jgi:hypothetical protein
VSYYLLVPVVAVAVNMVPVLAPPTWTVLVGLLLTFDLNPWAVAVTGVIGATIGRFLLGLYAPRVARRLLHEQANQNLAYLGSKLDGRAWSTMLFVFLYSLTPFSTSSLFTATAIAHTRQVLLLPPFFVAKLISYLILVWSAEHLAKGAADLLEAMFSWRGLVGAGVGVVLLIAVVGIDWQALLERREFRWSLRIRHRRHPAVAKSGTKPV